MIPGNARSREHPTIEIVRLRARAVHMELDGADQTESLVKNYEESGSDGEGPTDCSVIRSVR